LTDHAINKFYLAPGTEPNSYAARLGGEPGGQLFILMCRLSLSSVGRNIEENMREENVLKPTRDALLERFRQAFPVAAIQVNDESHLHVGHAGAAGGAGHFRVQVIDARFNGLQHTARHRLVYNAVSDWMPSRVHALNISAMTPGEAGTLADHAAESF